MSLILWISVHGCMYTQLFQRKLQETDDYGESPGLNLENKFILKLKYCWSNESQCIAFFLDEAIDYVKIILR